MKNFEKNPSKIRQKIEDLKGLGYTTIHMPGGTSKDGTHFAGSVVHYYDAETAQMFFIGLPYHPDYHIDKDNENGHNKHNSTPEETARRELMEEVGLNGNLEDFVQIWYLPGKDRHNPNKIHDKYFFCLEKFTGELHEFEGPNPIDGETAAPIWIPANLMKEVLFKGHIEAFQKALEHLSSKSMEYAYALMNLF